MYKELLISFVISIVLLFGHTNAIDPLEQATSTNYTDDLKLERTFIMLKPDAVQRGLMGKIIERFEDKGFKLVALNLMWANRSIIEKHYAHHTNKRFFPLIAEYMTSGPVVPMIWEGINVIEEGRQMITTKDTSPGPAPGTIRGDFTIQRHRSIIHGSDSLKAAEYEISIWFNQEDYIKWTPANVYFVYSPIEL